MSGHGWNIEPRTDPDGVVTAWRWVCVCGSEGFWIPARVTGSRQDSMLGGIDHVRAARAKV